MKFLIILTTLFGFGCAKDNQAFNSKLYIAYDSELSPAFQSKVNLAVQKINTDAEAELISLSPNDDHLKPLVFENIKSTEIFAHTQSLDYRCLISIDETNTIFNDASDTDVVNLRMVMLHEIGHCYNLSHSTDQNNVMFAYFGGTQVMDSTEIVNLLIEMKHFTKYLLTVSP